MEMKETSLSRESVFFLLDLLGILPVIALFIIHLP